MQDTQKIEYRDGDVLLEGYAAYGKSSATQKPVIIVFHDWSGRNEFACKTADKLSELGYIGFAADLYGNGVVGKTKEEKIELMSPLKNDRAKLRTRLLATFDAAKNLNQANPQKIAAIGFCFGGLCALDLARSGVDMVGTVSFHGLLDAPNIKFQPIISKVLVLHGHDDPSVPPKQVAAFQKEMTDAHVDWQVVVYGNTMHGFTNPQANDVKDGIVYNKIAADRSWFAMKNFLTEVC